MPGAADVEAYLAGVPAEQRAALEHVRAVVRAAAPDAEEGLSYGLPAFRLKGKPLAGYGASRGHCGYYPMSGTVVATEAEALAGFATSKGTVRFTPRAPLPDALIARLVAARRAEIEGAA